MKFYMRERLWLVYKALVFSDGESRNKLLDPLRLFQRCFQILANLGRHQAVRRSVSHPHLHTFIARQPQLPFKYLRRSYLAANLDLPRRSEILAHHFDYIIAVFQPDILRRIAKNGISLCKFALKGGHHEVILTIPHPVDNEGELALEYVYGGQAIYILSFTFASGANFGLSNSTVAVISRIQALNSDRMVLRETAKDVFEVAPRYVLAAALQGLVLALCHSRIVAVSQTNQVTFDAKPQAVSRASYDAFFQSLGGYDLTNGFFGLDVPFPEKETTGLSQPHRRRSRQRRAIRQSIADQVQVATSELVVDCRTSRQVPVGPARDVGRLRFGDFTGQSCASLAGSSGMESTAHGREPRSASYRPMTSTG